MAKKRSYIDKILILRPLLDKITDSRTFIRLYSQSLRINAGIILLGVLFLAGSAFWSVAKMWSNFSGGMEVKIFFGVLLFEIFIFVTGFIVINILLIRAKDIENLPIVKIFPLNPIVVISIRMTGEITASIYSMFSIALGIIIWIGASGILEFVPLGRLPGLSLMTSAGSSFLAGLLTIFMGGIISSGVLFASYVTAESAEVLVAIARNTKRSS